MNIPTAEEFYNTNSDYIYSPTITIDIMKEFAKLHVQAALESAVVNVDAELVDTTDDSRGLIVISPRSILESYPLTNIK